MYIPTCLQYCLLIQHENFQFTYPKHFGTFIQLLDMIKTTKTMKSCKNKVQIESVWLCERFKGTHCTNMGADKLAENTPNAQNLSAQIVFPSPKVQDFNEKRLHWASVVRGQRTHCTKMGADIAKNTPNAQNLSAQFVCPSPKVLDFNEKRLHWAYVVCVQNQTFFMKIDTKCTLQWVEMILVVHPNLSRDIQETFICANQYTNLRNLL